MRFTSPHQIAVTVRKESTFFCFLVWKGRFGRLFDICHQLTFWSSQFTVHLVFSENTAVTKVRQERDKFKKESMSVTKGRSQKYVSDSVEPKYLVSVYDLSCSRDCLLSV